MSKDKKHSFDLISINQTYNLQTDTKVLEAFTFDLISKGGDDRLDAKNSRRNCCHAE